MNLATPSADLFSKGAASAHFEKYPVNVAIYLFPRGVSGRGPMSNARGTITSYVHKTSGVLHPIPVKPT